MAALITDQPAAKAVERAALAGLAIAVISLSDYEDRAAWNQALADAIDYYAPDLVVSAGFMRVIGEPGVSRFQGRLINTHPALLPAFPGAHAIRDALAAGVSETGATVHYIDSGVDTGDVIAQTAVPVLPSDDEATLHERVKVVERRLLLETVLKLSEAINREGSAHE